MGYRLDIYKNVEDINHNIYYGTKLVGYVTNSGDLLSIKYLCSIRDDILPEDFGFYYCPQIELNYSEFKQFIELYFFDLAHDEWLDPCNNDKEDFDRVYEMVDFGRIQIMNILKELTIEDKIIVGWC